VAININLIDTAGINTEHIVEGVQKSKNETCLVHNIELNKFKRLAHYLSENAKRKIYSRFSSTTPKPGDIFLVDKNHEINFNGLQLDKKSKAEKSHSYEIKPIIEHSLYNALTEKIRLATKAAKIGIWTWDIQSGEMIWDQAMRTLFDRKEFDCTIKSFVKMIHPEDVDELFKEVDKQLKGNQEFNYSFRIVKPNEEIVHLKAMGSVENIAGVPLLIGANWDITQEKIADQELKRKNDELVKLERFIDQSSGAIQVSNENGQLVYINSIASERLDIKKEDISNYHVWDFESLFTDNIARHNHVFDLKTNDVRAVASVNINQKTKEMFPVEVTVTYLHINDDGYIIANSRDISERKKNELALRESEAKHRFLVDVSQDLICIHGIDDIYNFVFPSITKLTGYKAAELIGKDPDTFFHPDDLTLISKDSHHSFMNSESTSSIHYRFKKKDGLYL